MSDDRGLSRWFPWLAALAYASLIFYLSTQSNPLPALSAHVWDKLLHLTEYGGLGFLLGLGLRQRPRATARDVLFCSALLGLLYGASDEVHQSFVPGRDAEVGDVMADTLGCFLGGCLSLAAAQTLKWRAALAGPSASATASPRR